MTTIAIAIVGRAITMERQMKEISKDTTYTPNEAQKIKSDNLKKNNQE